VDLPPAEIELQVNAITQREISEERQHALGLIAENLCNDFRAILDGANREDDCREPIYRALVSIDDGGKFNFPRKAGLYS
jgi:hypothetical protein